MTALAAAELVERIATILRSAIHKTAFALFIVNTLVAVVALAVHALDAVPLAVVAAGLAWLVGLLTIPRSVEDEERVS